MIIHLLSKKCYRLNCLFKKIIDNGPENNNSSLQSKQNNLTSSIRKQDEIIHKLTNENYLSTIPNIKTMPVDDQSPSKIIQENTEITDAHKIAESFNKYFFNIGNKLATTIPNTNISPLSFMDSTQT